MQHKEASSMAKQGFTVAANELCGEWLIVLNISHKNKKARITRLFVLEFEDFSF